MSDTPTSEAPVSTPSAPSEALASLTPEARQQWRLTGEFPSASAETTPATDSTLAASSPAEPAEQAASTDATQPPASEPGTPKKSNAETRKAELNAEIRDLIAKRDALKREAEPPASARPAASPDVTAASSPAGPRSLSQEVMEPDITAPMLSEEDFFARYPEARYGGDYNRYVARYEVRYDRAESARQAEYRSRAATLVERTNQALAEDASFREVLNTTGNLFVPIDNLPAGQAPRGINYAAQELMASPMMAPILKHLHGNPAMLDALQRSTPEQAIRMIAKLEARFETPSSVPTPSAVVKTTTSAPALGTTLGTRQAEPADKVRSAVAAGDFAAYKSAMNRQEVAS